MKYIVLLVLILAVYAKKVFPPLGFKYFLQKQGIEFNATRIYDGMTAQECKNLYAKGYNYLIKKCEDVVHPKKTADETFCMMKSSDYNLQNAYTQYGAQVCLENYSCAQFNDDSVNFLFTTVFETPIPTANGRGLDYWFTEGAKISQIYHNDNCKSMIASVH